jgi:hypothetical protein
LKVLRSNMANVCKDALQSQAVMSEYRNRIISPRIHAKCPESLKLIELPWLFSR